MTRPIESTKAIPHFPVLDGFRGLAILLILIHHAFLLPGASHPVDRVMENATRPLWLGVELFFVMSGFLVTRSLVNSWQRPDFFWKFYIRRAIRILPLYFIALILFLAVLPLIPDQRFDIYRSIHPDEKASFWLFYMNYYYALTWPAVYLGHFWALCIEIHFYLVWPLVIRFCRGRFLWAAIAGILMTTFFRVLAIETGWWTSELGYHATHLRMDAILIGSLACWIHHRHNGNQTLKRWLSRLFPILVLASLLLLLFFKPRSSPSGNLIGYPVIDITMAVFLLLSLSQNSGTLWGRVLLSRSLHHLGRLSYAIYIFHFPILQFTALLLLGTSTLTLWQGMAWPAAIGVAIVSYAATWLIAWILWHSLEKRLLAINPGHP